MASRTRGGKKRGGSKKVSSTLSKQRFKNTGGFLGSIGRGISRVRSDVAMGLGLKEKDYKYEARTARNIRLSKERDAQRRQSDNDNSGPAAPQGPTAAELEAQRKAEALAKRKAEGQKVRKKFEKEKGERRIALRKRYMKLLKLT